MPTAFLINFARIQFAATASILARSTHEWYNTRRQITADDEFGKETRGGMRGGGEYSEKVEEERRGEQRR